jgi:hypothetical protein
MLAGTPRAGPGQDESLTAHEELQAVSQEAQHAKETAERLADHLARTKKQVQAKADRLRELNRLNEAKAARLAAARDAPLPGQPPEYAPFDVVANSCSPLESVLVLQKTVEQLLAHVKRRAVGDKDAGVKQVRILYGAEECWFRVTPNTTFADLSGDACRYWETEGVLRDNANLAWPRTRKVQEELQRVARLGGGEEDCVLRLGSRIVTSESSAPPPGVVIVAGSAQEASSSQSLLRPPPLNPQQPQQGGDYMQERTERAYDHGTRTLSFVFHDAAVVQDGPARAKHLRRDCAGLAVWALALALVLSAMVYRFATASAFYSDLQLRERLERTPFTAPPPASFAAPGLGLRSFSSVPMLPAARNLVQVNDVWAWLQQVLLPALFPAANESSPLVSPSQPLLGSVLLKQWRVRNDSCVFLARSGLPVPGAPCYAPYTLAARQTAAFSGAQNSSVSFAYAPDNSPVVFGRWVRGLGKAGLRLGTDAPHRLSNYDGGGFAEVLSSGWTREQASAAVAGLEQQQWLDQGSSALCVFFSLANVNLGLALSSEALVEFGASGPVWTRVSMQQVPLSLYAVFDVYEPLLVVGDVALGLYAVGVFGDWVVRPVWTRQVRLLANLSTVWNAAALLLFLLAGAQLICSLVFEFQTRWDSRGRRLGADAGRFVVNASWAKPGGAYMPLGGLQGLFNAVLGLSAVNLLLVLVSVFKHTQADPFTSRVWQTLHRAARPLGVAILVFAVALASMALWAHISWGAVLFVWNDAARSAASLVGVMFGAGVDFKLLRESQITMFFVVVFFLAWFLLVWLVLVQVLGAVIIDAFFEVAAVLPANDEDGLARCLWNACVARAPSKSGANPPVSVVDEHSLNYKKASLTQRASRWRCPWW